MDVPEKVLSLAFETLAHLCEHGTNEERRLAADLILAYANESKPEIEPEEEEQ